MADYTSRYASGTDVDNQLDLATHSNRSILDGTTESYTTEDKESLADMKVTLDNKANLSDLNNVFFPDKKWIAYGDSITDLNYNPDITKYTDIIEDYYKFGSVINRGLAASCVSRKDGVAYNHTVQSGYDIYFSHNSAEINDYDDTNIISIMYGINDFSFGIPFGKTLNTSSGLNLSPYNIWGAMNSIIRDIKINNPLCEIIIISPIYRESYSYPQLKAFDTQTFTKEYVVSKFYNQYRVYSQRHKVDEDDTCWYLLPSTASTTAPEEPTEGDLWIDTSGATPIVKQYSTDAFVTIDSDYTTSTESYTVDDYCNVFKAIAKFHSLPYVDLHDEMGAARYRSDNNQWNTILDCPYLSDNLHPNQYGQNRIANLVYPAIEKYLNLNTMLNRGNVQIDLDSLIVPCTSMTEFADMSRCPNGYVINGNVFTTTGFNAYHDGSGTPGAPKSGVWMFSKNNKVLDVKIKLPLNYWLNFMLWAVPNSTTGFGVRCASDITSSIGTCLIRAPYNINLADYAYKNNVDSNANSGDLNGSNVFLTPNEDFTTNPYSGQQYTLHFKYTYKYKGIANNEAWVVTKVVAGSELPFTVIKKSDLVAVLQASSTQWIADSANDLIVAKPCLGFRHTASIEIIN